jgi:hypothetical protein
VRTEASAVLGALAGGVGRGLAAALRPLAGPWWLAQFDPATEAARTARAAFQAAFPGARQREALLFCRAQARAPGRLAPFEPVHRTDLERVWGCTCVSLPPLPLCRGAGAACHVVTAADASSPGPS